MFEEHTAMFTEKSRTVLMLKDTLGSDSVLKLHSNCYDYGSQLLIIIFTMHGSKIKRYA